MNSFADLAHPLRRDGTSQEDRFLQALDPSGLQIDQRSDQDILAFVFKYASQVSYYDQDLALDDWTVFFQRSIPVQLALTSKFPVAEVAEKYDQLSLMVKTIEGFDQLFPVLDYIFDQATKVLSWQRSMQFDNTGFIGTINNLVTNDLSLALRSLIAIGNAMRCRGNGYDPNPKMAEFRKQFSLLSIWKLNPSDFIQISPELLNLKGSDESKIEEIKKRLDNLFQIFFRAMQKIVGNADRFFPQSIKEKDDHPAHLGLFYAFLRLFQKTKDRLNKLSQRHLDFFFHKALQIKERSAVPDQAHLVFELGPGLPSQLIPEGTQFNGGQDENAAEIIFRAPKELVVTPAKVESIRTLFVDRELDDNPNECGPEPIETKCKIRGIYKADVANSADGKGEADFEDPLKASWSTLGSKESKLITIDEAGNQVVNDHDYANLGLVLAAPVLLLGEGERCIQVDLAIDQDLSGDDVNLNKCFKLRLSGESGWVEVQPGEMACSDTAFPTSDDYPAVFCVQAIGGDDTEPHLRFRIRLDPTVEPITFPNSEVLEIDFQTQFPLLSIEFNQDNPDKIDYPFCLFENITVSQVCICVYVCGVRSLILHNDIGALDSNQPFQPFSFSPKSGSSFYLGSREIFCKNWSQLKLNYTWERNPADIAAIYLAYANTGLDLSNFFVSPAVIQNQVWIESTDAISLFEEAVLGMSDSDDDCLGGDLSPVDKCSTADSDPDSDPDPNTHNHIYRSPFEPQLRTPQPEKIIQEITEFNKATTLNGFLRLNLQSTDDNVFYLNKYQEVLLNQTRAAADLASSLPQLVVGAVYVNYDMDGNVDERILYTGVTADKIKITNVANGFVALIPESPYIPTIKDFSVDYAAKASADSIDLIHLHPFGHQLLKETGTALDPLTGISLFPDIPADGNLYIGLSNLKPGGNLDLLFQMAESTADAFLPMATVKWYYLKNDNFDNELEADIDVISDDTQGLVGSGVISFTIPSDISTDNHVLPSEWYWIRAAVRRSPQAVAETINIHPNATKVIFEPSPLNDLERLDQPLPAGSIGQSVQDLPGIQSFEQLYPSFGGRRPEKPDHYYTRVSELLRHKGRGITIFDYERIVLENFPEIFKVKCISHTLGRNIGRQSRDLEYSPGFVNLAVIPQLSSDLTISNILEPRVPSAKLKEIEAYLKSRISPFICLRVLNPDYEQISVTAKVKFRKGKSPQFYAEELERALTQFLSPWAFENVAQDTLVFGGIVYKSALVHFMEQRPYVDYIVEFSMRKNHDSPENEIVASRARSILVSGQHQIMPFEEACCVPDTKVSSDEAQPIGSGRLSQGVLKIADDE